MTERRLRLEGKVAIVTGAGSSGPGIGNGKAAAVLFAREGAKVLLVDVVEERARETQAMIDEEGGEASVFQGEVTNSDDCRLVVESTVERYGRLDILDNNVGISRRGTVVEISEQDWDQVMAVNLRGIFVCCRAVYPHMKEQGGGRIVNISSSRIWEGNPNRLDYTTSKAGVIGLTRALAREEGDDGIGVNAITPGFTMSETQVSSSSSNYMAGRDEGKCFKRPQYPDDLVGAVMFLLSDASGYISGQTLNVDGGTYMH